MAYRGLLSVSFSLILFFCLCFEGLAQQTSQTATSGANGSNGGSGTATAADPNYGSRPGMGSSTRSVNRTPSSVFIIGTVALEDGSVPPPGVVIERVCGGQAAKEAYPGPDGSFSFQVGADASILQNAADDPQIRSYDPMAVPSWSVSSPRAGAARLAGCDLRAELGGYRSNVVALNISQTMGNYDAGTIILYPVVRVPGTTISVTDMGAPKKARKLLTQGENALKKNDLSGAEEDFMAALAAYPRYASAWFHLGQVYEMRQRNEEARRAFGKALEVDGNYVGPYVELARMAALERKWEETADLTDRALKLNPLDLPYGYYLDALANYYLNRLEAAEKSARMLERLDGQHRFPEVFLVLANVLRRKHDTAGEVAQLWAYLKWAPQSANAPEVRARAQKLSGSGSGS